MTSSNRHSKIHHGWYILAASFAFLFFQSGARYGFGVMFKPMITELGWTRASISSAFFLNMTIFAVTLSVTGKIYDRYGPRWIIFVSTILLSAGFICIAFIRSLWEFYLYYGILAALGMGAAGIPLMGALMSKWFEKQRGLAISLALAGNCIGQFALVPLYTALVIKFGWRITHVLIGAIILLVNLTIAFFVIKGDPGDYGLKPYGREEGAGVDGPNASDPAPPADDLTLTQSMGTVSFWLILIVMFVCGSADFLIIAHFIPMVTDHGISATTAGHMMAWFGLLSMGGILVAGPLSDLVGNKIPFVLPFLLRFLLFLMILKYQNLLSFYIFAVVFGFTFLITAPLITTLTGRLYGFAHIGLITGFITTIHHLGGGFWAYVGGLVFDSTGSYRLIFVFSAVLAAVAVVCGVLIREKRHYIN
jgi:MFS family permease